MDLSSKQSKIKEILQKSNMQTNEKIISSIVNLGKI